MLSLLSRHECPSPESCEGLRLAAVPWPSGLGISDVKGLPDAWSAKQNLRWKTELPGAGASSPVVVGDRVFVTCHSGYGVPGQAKGDIKQLKRHLLCINAANGQIRWTKDVPATLPESQSVREHGYAASTPCWDGERLYVFFGKSGVYAFDLDGKQLWKASVGDNHHGWGSAAPPVVFKDLVIINACIESESLVALDKKTGKEKWRAKGIKESWNTPLVVTNKSGRSESSWLFPVILSHSILTLASRYGTVQPRLPGTWLPAWLRRMVSSTLWVAEAGSQPSRSVQVGKVM